MNIVGKITTADQSAPDRLNSPSCLIKDCCGSLETPGAMVACRDLHPDSGIVTQIAAPSSLIFIIPAGRFLTVP